MASRVLRVMFVAYVAATAVHIALVMLHEPFTFDAWNMANDTHAQPFSLGRFFSYGVLEYTHSNPRIGQWFTYLAYKLEYFAPIATPLAYLAIAGAVTVLGLGRWPRRGRDLAFLAIAIGSLWFALPHIGMIMFCRAYGANYLYGAAIQLWFLVPLRLPPAPEESRFARRFAKLALRLAGVLRIARLAELRPATLAYFLFGIVAGMCNEHTGPTLVLFMVGYLAVRIRARRGVPELAPPERRRTALVWAGAVGSVAGFAAIFFAPGQASRYEGLATKVSLVGRLFQRGVIGNLDIFRDWLLACAPVLGLVVIALVVARRERDATTAPLRFLGGVLIAGSVITATVFVSPKLGPRFYLHGAALVLAGFLAIADHTLTTTRRLVPFVVLAVAASIYAGVRTLPMYLRLSDASDDRLAALAATPRGGIFTAEAFEQVDDSWWFLGDDFRDVKKRDLITDYFALRGVIFRAVDIDAPLGVSDVRLVPRYQVTPASCLDEVGGLELGEYRGIDITAVHAAARAAIERLRDKVAKRGTLDRLDLVVDFIGEPPPLPRPTLVVARWRPDRFEVYAGKIVRPSASKTRQIEVPKELPGDYEIYAYQVSGEARRIGTARDPVLEYVPWKRGAYWALACRTDECFVIAATRVL